MDQYLVYLYSYNWQFNKIWWQILFHPLCYLKFEYSFFNLHFILSLLVHFCSVYVFCREWIKAWVHTLHSKLYCNVLKESNFRKILCTSWDLKTQESSIEEWWIYDCWWSMTHPSPTEMHHKTLTNNNLQKAE